MQVFAYSREGVGRKLATFARRTAAPAEVADTVGKILAEIASEGDLAVDRYSLKFDGVKLARSRFRIAPADMAKAWGQLGREEKRAIRTAIKQIESFHRKSLPRDWKARGSLGILTGERFYPIRRVGLYVPGGQVPLVSTVLMTAIPAKVAGVPSVAVVTPPQKDGSISPALLAALHACGISEAYRVGGVQAIGALAFGTRRLPKVDKIFGPGNAYVMEAKRQVFGQVGVDLLPGPSEVMVVADAGANPAWVAADLLAQAEHGTGKEKIYLAVPDKDYLSRVSAELEQQLPLRKHAVAIQQILQKRFLVCLCPDLAAMADFANRVAPEHLELLLAKKTAAQLAPNITTAGAMLLGYDTPTVLGDFAAGPSHTLPTDGSAAFSGGLQVVDFLRRTSLVESNAAANRLAWPVVDVFGRLEQLDGHRASLGLRLGEDDL